MKPITVFFDLDGVLADWVRGVMSLHRKYLPVSDVRWELQDQLGIEATKFWGDQGELFWKNLGMLYDGFHLLHMVRDYVQPMNTCVLSSPCRTYGCDAGKRRWIDEHLPADMRRRCFLGNDKSVIAGPGKLLIDDHDDNVDGWIKAGGSALLVPRPWNRERAYCDINGFFHVERMFNSVQSCIEVMRGVH